jgi:hypothetical protein
MKHILLFLLIYVFTSLSYITYAEDESKFEDLSCFSQVNLNYNFNNTSNKIYFESPEKNIQIIQDNKALDIKDIRSYLQYVAFESNI